MVHLYYRWYISILSSRNQIPEIAKEIIQETCKLSDALQELTNSWTAANCCPAGIDRFLLPEADANGQVTY